MAGLVPDLEAAVTEREQERRLALDHRPALPAVAAALARRTRPRGLTHGVVRDRVRVTELERFVACAYGWFVASVLTPRPLELEWDPAAEGSMGHAVLERTFRAMADAGLGACTFDARALPRAMRSALEAVAADVRPADAGRRFDAFVHGLGIRLDHRLAEEAGRHPRFAPARFEERFRTTGWSRAVTLSGTCDRIDLSADGRFAFVLDYKRSGRRLDKEGEVYLQIPLYAVMAGRALGAEPAGGAYIGVMKPEIDVRARSDAAPYADGKADWLESPGDWRRGWRRGRMRRPTSSPGFAPANLRRRPLRARRTAQWTGMALRQLSSEKRAILGSDESGVVSAGAGSGKTTLLARAVFEDVTIRGIPVERILVVAFNNAAAAHLVGRIQAEFVDWA